MSDIDLFIDLSRTQQNHAALNALVERLASPDGPGAITASATCLMPASTTSHLEQFRYHGWRFVAAEMAIAACNSALEAAALASRSLLLVLGPVVSGSEAISNLLETIGMDPMFGFALPRQSDPRGGIRSLAAEQADSDVSTIPRRALGELPEVYILPEFLTCCFLVRKELVANLGLLEQSFHTLEGAWLHYMCRARRIGFRCVVANTAVVENQVPGGGSALAVQKEDFWKLHRIYPDVTLGREQLNHLPAHAHERLLSRTFSADGAIRRTLLLDARGMGAGFNGTAYCALGLMDGLAKLDSAWQVTVMAYPQACAYHHLAERYPNWEITSSVQPHRFTAALRVSQPWAIKTIVELHQMALFNFYSMLDTIAWDVIYGGIQRLDETWTFLSQHADGIGYISDFTSQRFRRRFPAAPSVRHFTHHLSFHPADYVTVAAESAEAADPYILLVGNQLEHKYVLPTVELLACAFPFQSFQVLGCDTATSPRVTALPSGFLPEEQVERLYANARVIVFPSFYEGFGFPVIKGLSYGRTVIARRSDLLLEVAARHRSKGRLIAFETPQELVEMVGRVLHGLPADEVPLGTALRNGEEPASWVDIARNLLGFIEEMTAHAETSRWLARDQVIRQLAAFQA